MNYTGDFAEEQSVGRDGQDGGMLIDRRYLGQHRAVSGVACLGLAALVLVGCGGTDPTPEPPTPEASATAAAPSPEVTAAPSGNSIPIGPPDVRARALGLSDKRIKTIQSETEQWWNDQDFVGQKSVCQSLKIDPRFMGNWMADTGFAPGPEQELAAQTLVQFTDSFCWRLEGSDFPAG
jgi:hypothetical protein